MLPDIPAINRNQLMRGLLLFFFLMVAGSALANYRLLPSSPKPILLSDSVIINSDLTNERVGFIIDSIVLLGNNITKDFIILRELDFKTGDTISSGKLFAAFQISQQNLMKTSLFNFVNISDSIVGQGDLSEIHVHIAFVERWYLWPFPIFEISDRNLNVWWQDKNFDRVSYGLFLNKENNRGRMEKLRLLLRFGYDERYEISYQIPYINQKQTFGAGMGMGWIQNHEVAYQTLDNKQEFIRDESKYLFTNYYSYFTLTHRPTLFHYHMVQLKFNYFSFGDTVLALNPNYSFNGSKTNEYFSLNYQFISDHRDSKVYPLVGNYFSGQLSKSGLGITKTDNLGMMDLMGSYRKYWDLPNNLYFSTDWTGKISTNRDQPYFYQRGLGYDRNFVRGYELYVIDGQSYVLSKNTMKYALIPPKVSTIGFIKSEKFSKIHYALYANLFVDLGYVDAFRNYDTEDLAKTLLLGAGVGLDLVTYYDMVLRVEFSINKKGEAGIYFHLQNTL